MGALPEEILRVLFLDASRRLVVDEQMQHGSVRQLALYTRTMFRRAHELVAAAILRVHNHPSGDPNPDESDITVNTLVRAIGRALDVALNEHSLRTRREWREDVE